MHIKNQVIRVGLIGFGKAGRAVAHVLAQDPLVQLAWVARRHSVPDEATESWTGAPVLGLDRLSWRDLLDQHPVDAIIDFSNADSVWQYGDEVRRRGLILVSAISSYDERTMAYLRSLGASAKVMSSPNITLGINFLIMAARILRRLAPFADVEILEQHFKEKPEISGTARKIADTLDVEDERITSLRLGGIVGHHEVIFGFPHQTVRLTHESIRREAFGTGAIFAIKRLAEAPRGFYTFEDLMMREVKAELAAA